MKRKRDSPRKDDTGVTSPVITEVKGTLPPLKKRYKEERKRNWFLTWNNPPKDYASILKEIGSKKYAFQLEKGEQGTEHVQGVFCFPNAIRFTTLREKVQGHWKGCRNVFAAKNYCTKLDTRAGPVFKEGWEDNGKFKGVPDPLEGKDLYHWQAQMMDFLEEEPDDRIVHWVYDKNGCTGKTALCKHLVLKRNALILGGTHKDAFHALASIQAKGKQMPTVILFDLYRSFQGISYSGLEGIKNGFFFSPKFDSGMVVFKSPHVIVMSNQPPDVSGLTMDRWRLWKIVNKELKQYTFAKPTIVL